MSWFDTILRSAGSCPVREAADESSPCGGICGRGLESHVNAKNSNVRWVTAGGWGNPDASLYIVGTTPRTTLVLLGQRVATALYAALEITGPIPRRDHPVVVRTPDAEFSTPIIASQAVMGAKMAGLNRDAWVSRHRSARFLGNRILGGPDCTDSRRSKLPSGDGYQIPQC